MMDWLTLLPRIPHDAAALLLGVLGLFLGSFYNVCSDRYLSGESIVWPPSHCTHCGTRLSALELIPLVSWLCLRGRCAHCKEPIGWRYPLMELTSGVTAALVGWRWGLTLPALTLLVFTGLFLVLSAIDLQSYLLPDKMTLPGAILAVPAGIWGLGHDPLETLLGGLIGVALFWGLALYYRWRTGHDGLGFGDVKLMAVLGCLCGVLFLPLILLVSGISALLAFGAWCLKRRRVAGLTRTMLPFGPFLCLGAWISLLYGDAILSWWMQWLIG